MFRTMFNNKIPKSVTPAGCRYRDVYIELEPFQTDEKGECVNKSRFSRKTRCGEVIDVQAQINSYLEGTRLENILKSMTNHGRQTISFDENSSVVDFSDIPNNIYEIKQAAALAPQVKAEYEKIKEANILNNTQTLSNDDIVALKNFLASNKKGDN